MTANDTDILAAAEAWSRAGRGVAIATVVETWGSAPRPVGSHLVIDSRAASSAPSPAAASRAPWSRRRWR